MAFNTEKEYTATAGQVAFAITFPFLESSDIKVRTKVSTATSYTERPGTDYTVTGTTLTFIANNPVANESIVIYRNTNIDKVKVVFQAGASIRAQDLNNIATQLLYAAQEYEQDGITLTLPSGYPSTKNEIRLATENSWVIVDGVVTNSKMAVNSIDSNQYVDGSIDREHLVADIIDASKIENDAVRNEHIATDAVNVDSIAANSVGSSELINDSVVGDHIVDNAIGNEHMKDNAIDSAEITAGAVDLTHLSASGTKSSSTYLRGDNTWNAIGQTGLLLKTAIGYGPSGSGNIFYNSSTFTTVVSATISPTAATNDMIITWAGGWQYGDEGDARLEGRILRTVGGTETEIWASDHIIYRPGTHGGQVKGLHSGMIRMDDGYDTTSNVTYSFQVKKTQGANNTFYSDVNNHTLLIQEIQA